MLKKIIQDTLEKQRNDYIHDRTEVQILHLDAGVPGSKPVFSRNDTTHIPGKNVLPRIWSH